jgi:transaldolase
MAIFIDSADENEVKLAREFGWVQGVTTNPILLAQTGLPPVDVIKRLSGYSFKHFFYQLVSTSLDDLVDEAKEVYSIVGPGLVLKVAPSAVGFRFVSTSGSRYACCVTAIYSPAQALVAREAGARYLAVYVNRATHLLGDGIGLVRSLADVLDGSQTEIVAASLKSVEEAVSASVAGAQHITVPFQVLRDLPVNPLSEKTMQSFEMEGVGIKLERTKHMDKQS